MKNRRPAPRPAAPPNLPAYRAEAEQLQILASYAPDALEGDTELAAITRFAAHLCQAPVAAVTVVGHDSDRFLINYGSTLREIPREIAFCPHAMEGEHTMEVPDATEDPRFSENPSVQGPPHIRFYAGQPLISPEGAALGALSVIDTVPRPGGLTALQREGLTVLAEAVMLRLRAHRKQLAVEREIEAREEYLRTLADSIPDIAWSADADGKLDYHNARFTEYAGGTADENPSLIHPDDFERTREAWKQARETGEEYEVEHRVRRADGQYRWMIARAVPMKDDGGRVLRWFGTTTDIDDTHKLSESREVLARELSHRIKNIFAVIGGLVSLTLRKQPGARELGDELIGMIQALGRAHRYVDPVAAASSSKLRDLLGELFAPYFTDGESRIEVTGDNIDVSPRAVTPLALVFHELATNSAKYGALSAEQGRIHLALERDEEAGLVRFTWTETGGPAPDEAASAGFGSQLMDMSISGQLRGKLEREWLPSGLVVELEVPFDVLAT